MDFWAQHKDFILKVLAGFGVFLVAVIARGIVYGDDLETAQGLNRKYANQIKSKRVVSRRKVAELTRAAKQLRANVDTLAKEIGWDASNERELRRALLATTFRRLIALGVGSEGDSPDDLARIVDENFDVNLNGTFGALRLRVRDDVLLEAGERNVALPEDGLGFGQLVSIDSGDLLKYLLQLELMTRVLTNALGMEIRNPETGRKEMLRVEAIEEVRIDTQDTAPPLGGGVNPQFLREYEVRMVVRGDERTIIALINQLEASNPRVPIRSMRAERRPRGMIAMELRMLAVAVNTGVAFAATEETGQ